MTIDKIKKEGLLLFESVSGSRAYGLSTPTSDTDIRGVFVLPKEMYYSMDYVGQVNNETNDEVYYELKRFTELCVKNNPNVLELLSMPKDCIRYKHPLFDKIKKEIFLSKLCEQTFSNYAFAQIKKARGLHKKIVNPMEKERKKVQDFCMVRVGKKVMTFKDFVVKNDFNEKGFGVSNLSNIKYCYNLFYSESGFYKGIAKENANELCLSSISKEEQPIGMLYFNQEGYSSYCKKYREYWVWVEKRNEDRYKTNVAHDKNYDSKNMMHTFRLLHMSKEIAECEKLNVRVTKEDRAYLLNIKKGNYEYEDLVQKAEGLKDELSLLFKESDLVEKPDLEKVNHLLFTIRNDVYNEN